MSKFKTLRAIFFPCIVLGYLLSWPLSASAQYTLKLGSADFTMYPKIQIPFEIIDNSSPVDTIRADAIKVFENGVEMLPVEVECGGNTVASKIHFMFLMDVSLSMAFREGTNMRDPDSVKWRTAKRVFSEAYQMLRPSDEGALGSFAADFYLEQNFTLDKKLLADATMGMFLRSGTAIYDAIATAVSLLEQRQGKRVIILLTDGVDNSSSFTLKQAVNLAWGRGIPVHVIGLGFYPDQQDPGRVDKDTLQSIADGTSGKAYFTAKSEELSEIFDRIIKSIYSVSCVARYTAPDTCEDGSARVVAVQATVRGQELRESLVYTLPDLRSRLRLSVGLPPELTHDRLYTVPISTDGEIRAGEPLDLDFTVRYDPAHLEYRGLDPAAGVLNPGAVLETVVVPGEIRFTTSSAIPNYGVSYGGAEVLFSLRFHVLRHEALAVTSISLAVGQASQRCLILAQGASQDLKIFGCPENLRLVVDTTIIAPTGSEFVVPILLTSELDVQQALKATISINFSSLLEYLGYEIRGTVLEGSDVVESVNAAMVTFAISSNAPKSASGVLIYLRFRSAKLKVSTRAALTLLVPEFTQYPTQSAVFQCVLPVTIVGADVWIDGICSPLVRRTSAATISSVFPVPVSAATGSVDIGYTVSGTHPMDLRVLDASGKTIGVIAEGAFSEGAHVLRWELGGTAPGMYMIVLRQGESVDSRKLLITR